MRPWLSIVGVGEDGLDGVLPAARAIVDDAEVLIGGERHLDLVPGNGRERRSWPSPLSALLDEIVAYRNRPVCVLATGDPMHYGIGVSLVRRIPREEMVILPGRSAFTLACARLAWPRAEVATLTLHGRPVELLRAAVAPGQLLLVLAEDGRTPAAMGRLLVELGYEESPLWVLEHMGGPQERVHASMACEIGDSVFADFNTVAVECRAGPRAVVQPLSPGLPDDCYRHDGQITKREVRAVSLAALMPLPRQRLWDVGAGAGSIAIEWLRAAPGSAASAIERDPARRGLAAENANALGVPHLEIVAGQAPATLADLDPPDAVFIGGGLSHEGLVETCWDALRPGGRLVANAVTLEGEGTLHAGMKRFGGELVRIAVSRAEPVGPYLGWRPFMPVTQWRATRS